MKLRIKYLTVELSDKELLFVGGVLLGFAAASIAFFLAFGPAVVRGLA